MWHKLITRRIGVQVAIFWNNALQLQKQVYGVTCDDNLTFWDGSKGEYYLNQDEWKAYLSGLYKLLEQDNVITTLPWQAKEFLEKTLAEVKSKLSVDFKKLNDKELVALYEKIVEKNNNYYTRMWIVFLLGEPIAETLRQELSKLLKDEKKTDKLLLSFSSPLELNDAMLERIGLLEIARVKNKLTESELEEKLMAHTEKFRHIPMFDFNHEPFTIEHFWSELEKIKNPEEELKEIKASLIERKATFDQQLKQLNLSPESRVYKLIQMLKFSVFLRDYRDGLRQRLNLSLKYLYEEIGRRANLTSNDLSLFTTEEISGFLQGKITAKYMQDEAAQRHQSFLLVQRSQKIEIYSGHKAKEIAARELGANVRTKLTEVKGKTGAKGKASGKAIVIHSNLDLNKVQDGCVLVAHMTRQDYVPAMRKCVAFVTDEGGITCHTAIIARELGVPCIVGTGNATEVFKDGDQIEVNADKGIAKKVK